ncbi:MAG: hypothetical protein IKO59_07520 [Bacteroidales bacterium]|nr:hypothetical protein [Bacteroidales bacterium]
MKNSIFKTGWFLLFAAGLLAVMSACKKENTTSELRAVMNDYANSRQKAYIDPEQYNCFVVNETVRVNNSTGVITALERSDRQCVIDEVPVNSGSNYNAFYPAKLLNNQSEDLSNGFSNVTVNFPQTQVCTRDANGNQIIDNPMIAQLSGFDAENKYTLHFNNVCALLKITVRTLDAFDSIRVTMSGQKLWGSGKILGNKVVMDGSATSERETVILSIPGHTNSPAGEAFYIMIPEVTLSSCTVTVSIKNGNNPPVKTFERTGVSGTLEYNKIHTLGNFTFNAKVFSVAANKTVIFSPGNLQWSYTGGGTTPTTHSINGTGYNNGTWRFAPNQYEIIGYDDTNATGAVDYSSWNPVYSKNFRNYQGWIDLFAWGGSGYGDTRPFIYTDNEENGNTLYYLIDSNSLGNYDWGAFNTIYNPKTKANDPYGTWRTLTADEWYYLLYQRGDNTWWRYSDVRFTIGNTTVNGLLVYPDSMTSLPNGVSSTIVANNTSGYSIISTQDFNILETFGCAFLPSAGSMANYWGSIQVADPYAHGCYWASSPFDNSSSFYLFINEGGGAPDIHYHKAPNDRLHSVRLVRDVR